MMDLLFHTDVHTSLVCPAELAWVLQVHHTRMMDLQNLCKLYYYWRDAVWMGRIEGWAAHLDLFMPFAYLDFFHCS